jgi:5'-phosphate synthase pdxT subunit
MVNSVNIGVIGYQGAITEHLSILKKTFEYTNTNGFIKNIKKKNDLENIHGIIIPGGESTTISKLLIKNDLHNDISKRIEECSIAIMGTCAGCVLLSSQLSDANDEIKLLSAMKMKVKRNAFGRQKESFEKKIKINNFSKPYNAIFIRAPVIEKVWGNCRIISKFNKNIVMTQQENLLGLSFHPELTNDIRIHEYFINLIKTYF